MKGTIRWAWPIVTVLLAIGIPFTCYVRRPVRAIDLVVVDKTVPFPTWIEHRSLFWLLRHVNVVKRDGTSYDPTRDYVGAHPPATPGDPPARTIDLADRHVERASLLYLADTYGVYREDLASGPKMLAALERSPALYGGLTEAEAGVAARFAARGGVLVSEFNTLASPTGEAARRTLEEALGVTWTRWIGRYFPRLEDPAEVPRWLVSDWERESGRRYTFEGPGYALVRDDAAVEILRVGVEVKPIGLLIERETPVDPLLRRAADAIPYPYWFDVVTTSRDTRVLASFRWVLEPEGRERLRARGLPERFPAVTLREAPGAGPAYYFAGDFADNPMDSAEVPFAGYLTFRRGTEAIKLAPSETAFYWRFYAPMMTELIASVERRAPR